MTLSALVGKPNPTLLLIGAHSDDIEIGLGGTLRGLLRRHPGLIVTWCVLSGAGTERESEARKSAEDFLKGAHRSEVIVHGFADTHFPTQVEDIKAVFGRLRQAVEPDLVFTHRREDLHQDHQTVNRVTWSAFRAHTILEYEIPKWDGDLGQPNAYVPISVASLEEKTALLDKHFATQRSKQWFDAEVFRGLARIRGMECRSPSGYAEAFVARKLVLWPAEDEMNTVA